MQVTWNVHVALVDSSEAAVRTQQTPRARNTLPSKSSLLVSQTGQSIMPSDENLTGTHAWQTTDDVLEAMQ